tara:strand:+ start:6601 stop:7500 length:900 start_codon:yes stop_codon:yes gene_type:complete
VQNTPDISQWLFPVIMGLIGVFFLLATINSKSPSFRYSVAIRWLRWVLIALTVGHIFQALELTERPVGVVITTTFLIWFILETGYNWLAIGMLSHSEIPLFPKFYKNTEGYRWPNDKASIKLRNTIRELKLHPLKDLKADLHELVHIHSSIHQDTDNKIRLQILFLPQRTNTLSACFILSSQTKSGELYITDNVFLPFGGYYPKNWHVLRRPWIRSLKSLIRLHQSRTQEAAEELVSWGDNPLEDINHQQQKLRQENLERGFLHPLHYREEYGKLTREGRYRVWVELWLLSYLGVSFRY